MPRGNAKSRLAHKKHSASRYREVMRLMAKLEYLWWSSKVINMINRDDDFLPDNVLSFPSILIMMAPLYEKHFATLLDCFALCGLY